MITDLFAGPTSSRLICHRQHRARLNHKGARLNNSINQVVLSSTARKTIDQLNWSKWLNHSGAKTQKNNFNQVQRLQVLNPTKVTTRYHTWSQTVLRFHMKQKKKLKPSTF